LSKEEPDARQIDLDVSDLDSDLELDDLIPTYLKIKGKLYDIDPSLVDSAARKNPRGTKGNKACASGATQSPPVRKLFSQLQQITSDALFDEYEAEAQWPAKRNQIAQEKAAKRQEQEPAADGEKQRRGGAAPIAPAVHNPNPSPPAEPAGSEDEGDILGGMFTAIPDGPELPQPFATSGSSDSISLRDFGKSSGLTPRRLLEETVRSRCGDADLFRLYTS
tara:strand:+ start:40265 stop:40927 length:663 start_codon:yes stop_codon:yes gene_type:complete